MGFFGRGTYTAHGWTDTPVTERGAYRDVPRPDGPHLWLDIYDSDVVTLVHHPVGAGTGRCYLGLEPRHLFEDPTANEPVDVDVEAADLARWAGETGGNVVVAEQVRALLADPGGAEPDGVVAEEKAVRLLAVLGVPLPAWLVVD